jgi:hypothetical protein
MANIYSDAADAGAKTPETQFATGTVTVPFVFDNVAISHNSPVDELYCAKIPAGATITAATLSNIGSEGEASTTMTLKVVQTGSATKTISAALTSTQTTQKVMSAELGLPYRVPVESSTVSKTAYLTATAGGASIATSDNVQVAGTVTYTFQRRDLGVNHSASDF